MPSIAPEHLHTYACTLAARAADCSRHAAATQDATIALTAQLCADIACVQSVVLEQLRTAWPTPISAHRQLASTIRTAVQSAQPGHTCEDWIMSIRDTITAQFDATLLTPLLGRWQSLHHLAALPVPTAHTMHLEARHRLADTTTHQFTALCRAQAVRGYAAAVTEHHNGNSERAVQHCYQADLAHVEAFLCSTAARHSDHALLSHRLRATLIHNALAAIPGLPAEPQPAIESIRAAIIEVLGPVDGQRITRRWQPTIEVSDHE